MADASGMGGTSAIDDSGARQGPSDAATGPFAGPTVGDFVGLNGFIDDDKDKLAAVGNVREYHQWTWNDGNGAKGYAGYPNSQLAFSLFDGLWDFDDYYGKLGQLGVLVFPCVQGSVGYLNSAMPPVASGADATSPASYVAHAGFMYQYAARYGGAHVAADKLKLASGQTPSSGLGTLPYYENGNEPDANWIKPDGSALFSPEATAAMSSADYDGHQATLGAGVGIKNADPNAKMVLAGLAGAGKSDWVTNITGYLDGMRAWSDAHRKGSFPADVINVHDYCFGPDPFGTASPRPALSPEACDLRGLLAKITAYRDAKLPGKQLWITEFGYDTHPRSRLRAPAIQGNSAEVVQGQWLVRSFLALIDAGLDRAFFFISRDECTGNDTACPNAAIQFATSGVVSQKGEEKPKAAFYFLSTFRARLSSMHYGGRVESGNANVLVARFYDAAKHQGAYVVWAPTSNATTVDGYALHFGAAITSATRVELDSASAAGKESPVAISQGATTLAVGETPTLVLVNGPP